MWQGRPVYVIGAEAGDLRSRQFWVDREEWYAVRVIEPVGDGLVRDVRSNNYRRLGGGWIAPEVLMLLDGEPDRLENYRDIQVDVSIDPARFDPLQWGRGMSEAVER